MVKVLITIAVVVVITVFIFLQWGLGVLISPFIGQGEQYKKINESNNRTFQYQHFFDLKGTIDSQAQNIKLAIQDRDKFEKRYPLTKDEDQRTSELREQKEQTVTGLQQICTANVQKYDNDAKEFTRNKFLDVSLPSTVNSSICEEGE